MVENDTKAKNPDHGLTGHSSTTDEIARLIKANGLRMTTQRRALIEVLNQSKTSLSIKELFIRMSDKNVKIDEASVYRITEAFKDLNIVHVHLNGKVKLCSHLVCEQAFHLSLECNRCSKALEPHLSSADEQKVAKILNLQANTISYLHVNYVCGQCL